MENERQIIRLILLEKIQRGIVYRITSVVAEHAAVEQGIVAEQAKELWNKVGTLRLASREISNRGRDELIKTAKILGINEQRFCELEKFVYRKETYF